MNLNIDDRLNIALLKLIKSLNDGEAWKGTPSALLEKLYEFESSMFLPKGAAALTSKIRGLNANGIYFKMGVIVSGIFVIEILSCHTVNSHS